MQRQIFSKAFRVGGDIIAASKGGHQKMKPEQNETAQPEFTHTSLSHDTSFEMMRFGKLKEMDRSFDIEYWQRQGDAAIFQAGWELAELYHRNQGMNADELRLQRTLENFQRP